MRDLIMNERMVEFAMEEKACVRSQKNKKIAFVVWHNSSGHQVGTKAALPCRNGYRCNQDLPGQDLSCGLQTQGYSQPEQSCSVCCHVYAIIMSTLMQPSPSAFQPPIISIHCPTFSGNQVLCWSRPLDGLVELLTPCNNNSLINQ